jgi:transposase
MPGRLVQETFGTPTRSPKPCSGPMRCVPMKTEDQLDLQALHRARSRLISERIAVTNQIRSFLLEHGIPVRQGIRFLSQQLPDILAKRIDVLSPRMIRIIEDLIGDWRTCQPNCGRLSIPEHDRTGRLSSPALAERSF